MAGLNFCVNYPACPPYGPLEKYKGGDGDLSMMTIDDFKASYRAILTDSVKLLKDHGVFCIVTGDFLDENGSTIDLAQLTGTIMDDNGMNLRVKNIKRNSYGTAAPRAKQSVDRGRAARVHETVAVFFKNPRKYVYGNFDIFFDSPACLRYGARSTQHAARKPPHTCRGDTPYLVTMLIIGCWLVLAI